MGYKKHSIVRARCAKKARCLPACLPCLTKQNDDDDPTTTHTSMKMWLQVSESSRNQSTNSYVLYVHFVTRVEERSEESAYYSSALICTDRVLCWMSYRTFQSEE
jgi:hypothetical protein